MKISVNGEVRTVSKRSLPELLEELGYGGKVVATAVNLEFVPISARRDRVLQDGDRLEVLAPMQGG